jgi:hypothetical protein
MFDFLTRAAVSAFGGGDEAVAAKPAQVPPPIRPMFPMFEAAPHWGPPEGETEPVPAKTSDEAVKRATAEFETEGPMTGEVGAVRAMKTLSNLPPAERAQAIDKLPLSTFYDLVIAVPKGRAEELKDLMEATTDPERKLVLWQSYQKARTSHVIEDVKAGDLSESDAGALTRAEKGDLGEIDKETELLKLKGKKLSMAEVEELMARKEEELRIEVEYGVNLTNAWSDDKERWSHDAKTGKGDLAKIEEALKIMPPEDRHNVTEYRRVHNNPDSPGAGAEHFPDDGRVQIYDANINILTGTLLHETGHNVDKHHEDVANEYKRAAGWQNFDDRAALKAKLEAEGVTNADFYIDQIMAKTNGKGKSAQEPVLINGKLYACNVNPAGGGAFVSYNANALPRVDAAEKTTSGWRDEWDYARTAGADAFADHWKLCVRDPLRAYSDFVDRPNDMVQKAEEKINELVDGGNPDPAKLEAALAHLEEVKKQRDGLATQWKIMREKVFKVDDQLVEDIAMGLPPGADLDRFYKQSERCSTPEQLEKLRDLYTDPNKHPVEEVDIDDAANQVPAAQRDAFRADADNCFTPEQVERLKVAYQTGKREETKDKDGRYTFDHGEWKVNSSDPDEVTILGW